MHLVNYIFTTNVLVELLSSKFDIGSVTIWSRFNIVLLSGKQKENETLRQFWNELNGLAARCNFGNVTESLVKEVFIINMNKKEVQQKLCTEPKDTFAEKIQFVISYEEGVMRQPSFDKSDEPNIAAEPNEINNMSTGIKRLGPTKKCFRCEAPFSPQHLKECKAMNITCIKC